MRERGELPPGLARLASQEGTIMLVFRRIAVRLNLDGDQTGSVEERFARGKGLSLLDRLREPWQTGTAGHSRNMPDVSLEAIDRRLGKEGAS